MSIRIGGIAAHDHASTVDAFQTIELNPASTIQVTELGISHNAAANDTNTPALYSLLRTSTAGTGTAFTATRLQPVHDIVGAPVTTALENLTANGTVVGTLHSWYVPTVSGVIWVAAPGREVDCLAAEFIGINVETAPAAGIANTTYMVWEE
jgi:hypothetical protein